MPRRRLRVGISFVSVVVVVNHVASPRSVGCLSRRLWVGEGTGRVDPRETPGERSLWGVGVAEAGSCLYGASCLLFLSIYLAGRNGLDRVQLQTRWWTMLKGHTFLRQT